MCVYVYICAHTHSLAWVCVCVCRLFSFTNLMEYPSIHNDITHKDENSQRSDNVHTFGHLQVLFYRHRHSCVSIRRNKSVRDRDCWNGAGGCVEARRKAFWLSVFMPNDCLCVHCVESIFMAFVLMVDLKSSLCFRSCCYFLIFLLIPTSPCPSLSRSPSYCNCMVVFFLFSPFSALFAAISLYDIFVCFYVEPHRCCSHYWNASRYTLHIAYKPKHKHKPSHIMYSIPFGVSFMREVISVNIMKLSTLRKNICQTVNAREMTT